MRPRWILAAAVLVGTSAAAWALWPNEARRVRAQVEAAAEALSPPPGEPDVHRIVRIAGLSQRLAQDIVLEAEPGGPGVRGREAVAGLAAQLSGIAGVRAVSLSDVEVTFDEVKTRATVSAVVHVTTAAEGQASPYDGDQVTIELRLVDGDWLIARAVREPTLTR